MKRKDLQDSDMIKVLAEENAALKEQLAAAQPAIEAMRQIEEMAAMDTNRYIVEISQHEEVHYYTAELWDTKAGFNGEPPYPFFVKMDTLIEAIDALYAKLKGYGDTVIVEGDNG